MVWAVDQDTTGALSGMTQLSLPQSVELKTVE